jgi:predicted tellurium resistance membrane protein TerC
VGFLKPCVMHVGVIHIAGYPVSIVSVVFGILVMRLAQNSLADFLRPPRE